MGLKAGSAIRSFDQEGLITKEPAMRKLVDLFCHVDDFSGFSTSVAKVAARKWRALAPSKSAWVHAKSTWWLARLLFKARKAIVEYYAC